jgi:HNH endonuclease/AP2 domain
MMTPEYVRELLEYDPITGVFTWRKSRSKISPGQVAGNVSRYRTIKIDRKHYLAHRLAWFVTFGEWPPNQIDHINGVRDDNRLINLRLATQSENNVNAQTPKNKTGFRGVAPHRRKWSAKIRINGRKQHLGLFDTPEEAYRCYCAAAQRIYGEFGRAT